MTTSVDNRQSRDANESWTDAHEFTMGVPPVNNVDPTGTYPNISYSFGFSINHGSTGEKIHTLWTGAGIQSVDLDIPSVRPSIFPHNQVNETPSGHVISIDDTPGGERILIKHRTGSGVEMKQDGSIIISTRKNRVEVVDGKNTVIVKGEANLIYEGNVNLSVTGDFNLKVGGDWNADIQGAVNTTIQGSEKKRIMRNYSLDVLENRSATILGDDLFVCIGERTDVVKGKYEIIGDDNIFLRTSADVQVSAANDISFASTSFAAVAKNMSVIGSSGTVGGEGVEHYGKVFSGPQSTFFGTLVGLAHEATTSRYAIYAKECHAAFSATFAAEANYLSNIPDISRSSVITEPVYNMIMGYHQQNPLWHMPTGSIIDAIHEQMDKGIIKSKVFDEEIVKRTSMGDQYKGVFRNTPSIKEVRIAMRDADFRNGDVPPILVAQGLLHPEWAQSMPTDVKRVQDASATSKFGTNRLGNSSELMSKRFKVRK